MAYSRTRSPRRTGRRGNARPRREPVWIRHIYKGITEQQWAAVGFDLLPQMLDATVPGLDDGSRLGSTVVRIRGHVGFSYTYASAQERIVAGIAVTPKEPAPPANPYISPVTDRQSVDWLWWDSLSIAHDGVLQVPATPGVVVTEKPIDVKSMRKIVAPGQSLNFYAQTDPGTVTTLNVWFSGSILVKVG